MPYKIDYLEGDVIEWSLTSSGVEPTRNSEYTPSIYVSGESTAALEDVQRFISDFVEVQRTDFVERRTVWREPKETVLRVDVDTIDSVPTVASDLRSWGTPGEYKLYNVDFSREFRYCLENDLDPAPCKDLSPTLAEITIHPKSLSDSAITPLTLDGDRLDTSPRAALEAVMAVLRENDPDVLVINSSRVVPLLYDWAADLEIDEFDLGRLPGFEQLAQESTYESYGRVGHSPARYNVPGRAIIDTSNSFFWKQSSLDGLFDLVRRSHKPLQETAWASIGNVFTAIQIREAQRQDVLVAWNSWRHEQFKSMATLQAADRGGFTFSPLVGIHQHVHELDFSSLYPNIMITRNVSPDTIRCDCHSDREDVPGLGYSICDEEGFLVRVLDPLVTAREEYKSELRGSPDPDRAQELKSRSGALKWILVSCFGYQGFSNAKFGRIECHEALNAFAREILLETKELLEANGWDVIHGIVDSVWVTATPDADQTPLDEVADEVTDEIGIPLEYEAEYDWIAFAPRRDSSEGALTRYFGKIRDTDEFKKRGIEARQRSTTSFIETCQDELLDVLDEHREPATVCDRLKLQLAKLRREEVDPKELVIRRRVSQEVDEYSQYTVNVAALERASSHEFSVAPGEDIEFVVVDDSKSNRDRVALPFEDPETYDAGYYADRLIRATESILSPMGWDRERIRRYLSETDETRLSAFN